MEYEEYTVIIDGALGEIVHVRDGEVVETAYGPDNDAGLTLQAWLDEHETAAYSDGTRREVYCIAHPHETGIDCECAQYVTDHNPDYVFGDDQEDDED